MLAFLFWKGREGKGRRKEGRKGRKGKEGKGRKEGRREGRKEGRKGRKEGRKEGKEARVTPVKRETPTGSRHAFAFAFALHCAGDGGALAWALPA